MTQRDRVCPNGQMLGRLTAKAAAEGLALLRDQGLLDHDIPSMRSEMCASCACRPGSIPNGCLQTQLDLLKAVVQGDKFLCHAPKDGRMCAGMIGARAAYVARPFPEEVVDLAKGWEYSPPDEDCRG